VLQVHPFADPEVIEAAYRQLMKKYHPDMAGTDPTRIAFHHLRAKALNEAYGVLRDPVRRRAYDDVGNFVVARPADVDAPRAEPTNRRDTGSSHTAASPAATPSSARVAWVASDEAESLVSATLRAPFAALAAAYYLLPGPYEWEEGRHQEHLTACLLPPLGVAAFALATGRLAPWIGGSFNATLFAWVLLLLLSLPTWRSLPRMAMAAIPSVVLITGVLDPFLRQASMPAWLAWLLLGFLSVILSARLFVFGVLPTLGVCWLLTRLG